MTEVGFVGLPQSGKSTLMSALTGAQLLMTGAPGEAHRGVIPVPDPRIDELSRIYNPKKATYATVQLTDLVGAHGPLKKGQLFTPAQVGHLRDMDLLVLVVRLFQSEAVSHPMNRVSPGDDLSTFLEECILADMTVAEKRIERIDQDLKKGGAGKKKEDLEHERAGLAAIQEALESESPVASVELTPAQKMYYKGFGFLTGKRIIPIANSGDLNDPREKEGLAALESAVSTWNAKSDGWAIPRPLPVNARLELELRELVGGDNLDGEEALEYFREVGLEGSSRSRIVQQAYASLGLISFLTAGEDEVRAWPIPSGFTAPEAAGTIHSDLQKGFIRAETVSYEDFTAAGDLAECRKKGTLRLEGKEYVVQDGDIVNIRFSV